MADIFTKAKRSQVMSRIRGRGNKETEIAFAQLLRQNKITGWRRHYPIFGKPDFAFPKRKLAVFVDGCFWHSCPKHSKMPVNNQPFWKKKLSANKLRDRLVAQTIRSQGWRVLRIWEHELTRKRIAKLLQRILRALAE
jgi:DNA mismatch endonuclease (patch repair protein)